MNASDERGTIGKARSRFARTAPIGGAGFKIISMRPTPSLGRPGSVETNVEKYSKTCRFILSVNYSSKIIEPIQSRCAVFRFRPLRAEDVRSNLARIAAIEAIGITDEALDALVHVSQGDMRKAVNSLQVAASLGERITVDLIYHNRDGKAGRGQGTLADLDIGDFIAARNRLDEIMINYGLREDIIKQIHRTIFDLDIPDYEKGQAHRSYRGNGIPHGGRIERRSVNPCWRSWCLSSIARIAD